MHDYYGAASAARALGAGLVLDSDQTVNRGSALEELLNVARRWPELVDEVHVHSRSGHGYPSEDDLRALVETIRASLAGGSGPLGVVIEVFGLSYDRMAALARRLMELIG